MESSPKRRKLQHNRKTGGSIASQHRLIDFEAASSTHIPNASAFILRTDELFREVRLGTESNSLNSIDAHLHSLRNTIEAAEPHEPISVADAVRSLKKNHGITIPFPQPGPDPEAPYKLAFAKPKCNVVGSYILNTMLKIQEERAVDLVAEMPKELFQEKDYLDMRYFYRRAYFLAYIAAAVGKASGGSMELSFRYLHDNPLLPILEVKPTASSSPKKSVSASELPANIHSCVIRVIPCAPPDLFNQARLLPLCCNNRNNRVFTTHSDGKRNETPTPFYNSTIKAEKAMLTYLRVTMAAKAKCPAFVDACILGRVWLQQRGFGGTAHRGGFGSFEWTIIMALLLKTGGKGHKALLSSSLSSTELFKAMMQFLSTTNFTKKPFLFGASKISPSSAKEPGPVIFDSVTEINILFKMSPWSAHLLQQYAKSTIELLGNTGVDQLEATFIVNANQPLQVFDATVKIEAALTHQIGQLAWHRDLETHKVLARALGSRAQLVHIQRPAPCSWLLKSAPPSEDESSVVVVGIIFELLHMGRQMEYGPSAEDQKDAKKFRQFWGERCELRRFKNGNILECVEWTKRTPSEICEEMIHHVLQRHFKLGHEHLTFSGQALFSVISMAHTDRPSFDAARAAFQQFESDIRGLDGLVLQVRNVSPISSSLRYSSVEVPSLGFHRGTVRPMDVVLSFEASSKWPENLVAIQHAKIDFLLDIGKRLIDAGTSVTTHLGRENVDIITANLPNLAYLDVVYPQGAVFRLRIVCDLEESLLDRQVKNKNTDTPSRVDAENCLHSFLWLSSHLPLHSQTVSTYSTRLPALSSTVRLVKHWFNRHMLSGGFSEELIELFVLHVFLQPYPWKVPSSPVTGFFRTLYFLSRWNWRDEPLVIDSSDPENEASPRAMSASDRTSVLRSLQTWRERDPNMNRVVMVVATPNDHSGLAYTRNSPSKLTATRMTRLASTAINISRAKGLDTLNQPEKILFQPRLRDYDVLIHISPRVSRGLVRELSREVGARHSQYKNLDDRTGKVPLPLRRHPVAILHEELSRAYRDSLLFFHGDLDHDEEYIIAALWDPKVPQTQDFRIGLPYNFQGMEGVEGMGGKSVKADQGVRINKRAVLAEIARLGGDLIKNIVEVEG